MTHEIGLIDFNYPKDAIDKARDFYTRTFGWKVFFEDPGHYIIVQPPSGPMLGLQQIAEGTDYMTDGAQFYDVGTPMVILASDDIDATLEKITGEGGTVDLPKTEIPGIGWWAIVTDPCGQRFGVRQLSR